MVRLGRERSLVSVAGNDNSDKEPGSAVGVGIALGAGVGAALFEATNNAVWIGVFVAVGAAIDRQRRG